jgi:1-acyl-sn-glycerol-3-phosphate acyltransferase
MAKKTIYYNNPLEDDFATNQIKTSRVEEDYPFIRNGILWKIGSFLLYYGVAMPILYLISKIYLGMKFHNRSVIHRMKKSGCFLYCNHTRELDAFIPAMSAFPKRSYIVANPDAVSIKGLKNIVMLLGCLPIPTSIRAIPKFVEAISIRVNQNACIGIFPEAHIWPFYSSIRPFRSTSFRYPVEMNKPVIAAVVSYRKRTGLFRWVRAPGMTITYSDPIYPDLSLSRKQAQQDLRDRTYQFMCQVMSQENKIEYIHYEWKDENEKIKP